MNKKIMNFQKNGLLVLLILVLVLMISRNSFADVYTSINVSNSAPILIQIIPNQSWSQNENKTNAFDLDDYFLEPNSDEINYSYDVVENITITINETTNQVSFYPSPSDFIGFRNTTFYASDYALTTPSNLVFLTVGYDTDAPKWSSPTKSRTRIYQSQYINFTTSWTDNYALNRFVFSINQYNTGWVNYTAVNFTGKQNLSNYRVQISAPGGTTVYWKFYAWDDSENMNVTQINEFNVTARPTPPTTPETTTGSTTGVGGAVRTAVFSEPTKKTYDFSVEPNTLKVLLKEGETSTRVLKISNTGNTELSFNISSNEIEDFVLFDSQSFGLSVGESRELTIDFFAPEGKKPEEYFGSIIINSSVAGTSYIPTIIDLNALISDYSVLVNISDEYKIVKPGEIIKANITITNLADTKQTGLTLYTAIKDFWGNIYDFSESQIEYPETTINLEKQLTIPPESSEGNYIFYARVSDENNTVISSDTFEVGVRFKFSAFLKTSFMVLLLTFLSLLLAILMVKERREKQKQRILGLYLMLNELKQLVKEDKLDSALELYLRIKRTYGEPIPSGVKQNKELLKQEIKKISERLKQETEKIPEKQNTPPNQESEEKKENKKEIPEEKEEKPETKPEDKSQEKPTKKENQDSKNQKSNENQTIKEQPEPPVKNPKE